MPKKKLPTGPIRIDLPSMPQDRKLDSGKQDSLTTENIIVESNSDSSQLDSIGIENLKREGSSLDSSKQDSGKRDSSSIESSSLDSNISDSLTTENNQLTSTKEEETIQPSTPVNFEFQIEENKNLESSLLENRITESTIIEGSQVESIKLEQQNQDNTVVPSELKPESSFNESKKVAMRLSSEAASKLRQFRAETGIPYEIMVDVMIRNWSSLPNRTKTAYLKQAKQIRQMRLMAGQEKTLKTMRQKYLETK